MITLTTFLLTIVTLIFLHIAYQYVFKRPEKCAPGPPRIPIFGSYLFLIMAGGKYLHKGALWFSKFYKSDVISLYLGDFITYVAHSPEGVREILNNSAFDGRPDVFVARMRDPNFKINGITLHDGPIWKEQRRFILRYLRDFGFGRRFQDLELVINEEIKDFIDMVKNGPKFDHEKAYSNNGKILCPVVFSPLPFNCVLYVMFNERIPREEQKILFDLGRNGITLQRNTDNYGKMLSIIPWVRHFFPEISAHRVIDESNKFLYEFMDSWVRKYMNSYTDGCERNFVDLYFKEMLKDETTGNLKTNFLYDQFVMSLADFMLPALTTISAQMSFIVQWLLLKPDVLKKVQNEIDEHVGSGRLPCLDDRKNLNYTEATIREGLRMESLIPSDIPHVAMYDTEFLGYSVKKGTIMMPSLYAYHSDKRVWIDPENFRPERFLDESGQLNLKSDVSLPFGAGKRLCAGETFARNMLFLWFSAICQNFNIVLAPGESKPDLSKTNSGFVITPPDFWATLQTR